MGYDAERGQEIAVNPGNDGRSLPEFGGKTIENVLIAHIPKTIKFDSAPETIKIYHAPDSDHLEELRRILAQENDMVKCSFRNKWTRHLEMFFEKQQRAVKRPTHPGFYWYKDNTSWIMVEVVPWVIVSRNPKGGLIAVEDFNLQLACPGGTDNKEVSLTVDSEWGEEVKHGD